MSSEQPTTEIEAVNAMLDAIGSSPINSLEGALPLDAVKARKLLSRISRLVQTEEWQFNSESDFPLSRNVDDEIEIPLNTLRVSVNRRRYPLDVTQRGKRLYDRCKHTFKFDQDVKVDIVIQLPFDDLPEFARQYIFVRGSREFQQKTIGSPQLDGFQAEDEIRARAEMIRSDGKMANLNILNGMGTFRPGAVLRR